MGFVLRNEGLAVLVSVWPPGSRQRALATHSQPGLTPVLVRTFAGNFWPARGTARGSAQGVRVAAHPLRDG